MSTNQTDRQAISKLRRSLLIAAGGTIFATKSAFAGLRPMRFAATQATRSVELISSTDPRFAGLIDAYFPGLSANRRYAKYKRYLGLLMNRSTDDVLSTRVRWERQKGGSFAESFSRNLVYSPTVQLERRSTTAQTSLLTPGSVLLVSPLLSITPAMYTKRFATGSKHTLFGRQRMKKKAQRMHRATGFLSRAKDQSVNIYLTGALMRSTGAEGSLGALVQRKVRNRRNAEHDEATALLQRSRVAGQLTSASLRSNIQRSLWIASHQSDTKHETYVRARASFAKKLLHLVNLGNIGEANNILTRVSAMSRTT